ncbi:MAG: DMT family transporter [Pseudomonadota bacterium]
MNEKLSSASTTFMVLLIGLLWGLNWPAVKIMLTEVPPLTIRAVAFPVAAGILAAVALFKGQGLVPARGEWSRIAVTGLLLVCGFNLLTTVGQLLMEASRAAIIAYLMPAMTVGLAWMFLGERLGPRGSMALAAGMLGIVIMASEDFTALVSDPLGILVMLLAALSWAAGNVCQKHWKFTLRSLPLTIWYFAVSTIVAWALVLVYEPPSEQSWPSPLVLSILIYHALGPMVICYALWTMLLDGQSASTTAITALLAPVVGVVSSIIILGEPTTWQKVVALALILASVALVLIPAAPKR